MLVSGRLRPVEHLLRLLARAIERLDDLDAADGLLGVRVAKRDSVFAVVALRDQSLSAVLAGNSLDKAFRLDRRQMLGIGGTAGSFFWSPSMFGGVAASGTGAFGIGMFCFGNADPAGGLVLSAPPRRWTGGGLIGNAGACGVGLGACGVGDSAIFGLTGFDMPFTLFAALAAPAFATFAAARNPFALRCGSLPTSAGAWCLRWYAKFRWLLGSQ
jgi:hypothetical protein